MLGGQLRVLLVGAAELVKLRYSPGRTNRCLPDGEAASLLAELPVLWPGLQIRSGKLDYTPLSLVPSWAAGKTKQEKLRHRFGQDHAVGESEALVFAQDGGSCFAQELVSWGEPLRSPEAAGPDLELEAWG